MSISKEEQEVLDRFADVSDEIHAIWDFVEQNWGKLQNGTYTKNDVYEFYGVDPQKLDDARRSLIKALHEGWGDDNEA